MNTTSKFYPTPLAIAITLALTASPSQAIVYTYDNLQRLTGAQYTSGQLLTYQYDPAGNLLNIDNRWTSYHLILGTDDNQVVIRSLSGKLEKSFIVSSEGQGLSLAVIDLDRDGTEELAVAKQQDSSNITFYQLDGTAKHTFVTSSNGLSLATGEMNGDSSEIAVAPRMSSSSQIALYNIAGNLINTVTTAKPSSFSVAIGDVNGDGKGDLVLGNLLGNEVMVTGGITFSAFEPKTPTLRKKDGGSGNGDKKVTLCHKEKNTLTVAESAVSAHLAHDDTMGECVPPATASSPPPTSSPPTTPGASPETTTPSITPPPPPESTTPAPASPNPIASPETTPPVTTPSLPLIYGVNVATGDVNGDGKAEIVAAMAKEGGMVEIYTEQGILINQFQAFENTQGVVVTTGDVNNDGRAEIITGEAQGTAVRIFTLEGQQMVHFQGLDYGKLTSLAFGKKTEETIPSAPTSVTQMPVTSPATSTDPSVTVENPSTSTPPQATEAATTVSPVDSTNTVTVNTSDSSTPPPGTVPSSPQATVAETPPVVDSSVPATTVATAPPVPIVPVAPACSTTETTLTETCRGLWQTLTNVTINSGSSIAETKLAGDIQNQGWVSNATILEGATLTGGVLTGYIENHGRVADIQFVGARLTGGELAGTILVEKWGVLVDVTILSDAKVTGGKLSGEVNNQGTLVNVRVMTETTVNGGKLAGTIENQGVLRDIELLKGARIKGGRLAGEVVGKATQKGVIKAARVLKGAKLVNVVVGKGTYVETGVVMGEGVEFE